MGFLWRWAVALVLLAATYNPTGYDFVHWAAANWSSEVPLTILLALALLAAYVVFLSATLRSIGALGMALVLAIAATVVWFLVDRNWISLNDPSTNTWLALLAMSLVLGIGLYWSILWRRLSGQYEVDGYDD